MYILDARLKHKNTTVGYRVKDALSGELFDLSKEEFRTHVKNNRVMMISYKRGRLVGRLRGIKEVDIDDKVSSDISGIEVYKGEACFDYISQELKSRRIKHRRTIFNECKNLLINDTKNLLILTGIRRMGKTVLSFQLLQEMYKSGKRIAYITIVKEVSFELLVSVLKGVQDCDVICIDEISRCCKFANYGAYLYDYSKVDRRLILTGTDSFVFPLALKDKLVGRSYVFNLTLLPYIDYVKIFGKDFNRYQCLTSFMDSDVDFNIRMTFTENIYNSLSRSDLKGTEYECLRDMDVGYLNFYILNALVQLVSYMNSKYTTIKSNDVIECSNKDKVKIRHLAMKMLLSSLIKHDVSDYKFSTKQFNLIRQALVDLGVLLDIPFYNKREFKTVYDKINAVYIQGYRDKETGCGIDFVESMYCVKVFGLYKVLLEQYENILNTLCKQKGYSLSIGAISGELLENVIRANLVDLLGDDYIVAFYRTDAGQEVDIIVYNKSLKVLNLYEVKHSTKQEVKFLRHITNSFVFNDICEFIGGSGLGIIDEIRQGNIFVIYRGETCGQFINVEDFLLNIKKYVI